MNCVIYVRVSTEEQAKEGFSIAAQKERLRAFAISQGWTIKEEYIEEGWSAKNLERPQLKKLLKDIEKGNINIVLVYRLDRLTRSVLDLYQLLKTFDEHNVAFKSATEVYDTSTAMGKLFITLIAALAEWERNNLAERVKFGMFQMVDEGKKAGGASSYGYKFDKDFNCEIVEHEAEAVRKMYQWYIDGYGYIAIAKKLNEEGYKPRRAKSWNHTSIKLMLTNPIYIGNYYYGGRTMEKTHEPIIDELTFHKVQAINNKRTVKDHRNGKHLLTGLLRCKKCDHGMTGSVAAYNKIRYRCYKCNLTITETKIITVILSELEKLITDKDYFISRSVQASNDEQEFKEIKEGINKIKNQKTKLLDLYADDLFDKNELTSKIKLLNEKEHELNIKLNELDIDIISPEEKYQRIENIINIKEVFKNSTTELQKELLQSIFDTVYYYKEKGDKNADVTIEYTLN